MRFHSPVVVILIAIREQVLNTNDIMTTNSQNNVIVHFYTFQFLFLYFVHVNYYDTDPKGMFIVVFKSAK